MTEERKGNYGYGKRPPWQWIVIYLVIGAIVYGAVYYFFLSKKDGYYPGNGQQNSPSYNYNK